MFFKIISIFYYLLFSCSFAGLATSFAAVFILNIHECKPNPKNVFDCTHRGVALRGSVSPSGGRKTGPQVRERTTVPSRGVQLYYIKQEKGFRKIKTKRLLYEHQCAVASHR